MVWCGVVWCVVKYQSYMYLNPDRLAGAEDATDSGLTSLRLLLSAMKEDGVQPSAPTHRGVSTDNIFLCAVLHCFKCMYKGRAKFTCCD